MEVEGVLHGVGRVERSDGLSASKFNLLILKFQFVYRCNFLVSDQRDSVKNTPLLIKQNYSTYRRDYSCHADLKN